MDEVLPLDISLVEFSPIFDSAISLQLLSGVNVLLEHHCR